MDIKTKEDVINFLKDEDAKFPLKKLTVEFDTTGEVNGFSFSRYKADIKIPGGVTIR